MKMVTAFVHAQMGGSKTWNTACCNWSASSLRLSHYSRAMCRERETCMRARAHEHLEKRTISELRVGVGIALAALVNAVGRVCVRACVRAYLCVSRERRHLRHDFAERRERSRRSFPRGRKIRARHDEIQGAMTESTPWMSTRFRVMAPS